MKHNATERRIILQPLFLIKDRNSHENIASMLPLFEWYFYEIVYGFKLACLLFRRYEGSS